MAYTNAQYRAQNQRLRAELAGALGKQFTFLRLSDLDGSWSGYANIATGTIDATARQAQLAALDHFRIWLHDEMGEVMAERLLNQAVPVDLNDVAAMLRLKGPIEIKRLMKAGWKPEEAWLSAMRQTVNVAKGYAHAHGQRTLVGAFAEYPHVLQGWKRDISPSACSFCRALERTVWNPSAQWEKPHDGCGCTAKPVPNEARVMRYLTPADRARNERLRLDIAHGKAKAKADFQRAAMAAPPTDLDQWIVRTRQGLGKATKKAAASEITELAKVWQAHGIDADLLGEMNPRQARQLTAEAKRQFDYYPKLPKVVDQIVGYRTESDWATAGNEPQTLAFWQRGSIHVNAMSAYHPDQFWGFKNLQWAVSRSAKDVLNHEFAHGILATFGTNERHFRAITDVLVKHGLATRRTERGFDLVRINKAKVTETLGSQYAAESMHEFASECWALYQREEGNAPAVVLDVAAYLERLLTGKPLRVRNIPHPNLGYVVNPFNNPVPKMRLPYEMPDEIVWDSRDAEAEAERGHFA